MYPIQYISLGGSFLSYVLATGCAMQESRPNKWCTRCSILFRQLRLSLHISWHGTMLPYNSLDQKPRLLFVSSCNFLRPLLEIGYYLSAAFIKLSGISKRNLLPQKRWSGCRCQGVNLKRHCLRYWAQGIKPLHKCWRGRWWVGGEWTCSRRLLTHYTIPSTTLKL